MWQWSRLEPWCLRIGWSLLLSFSAACGAASFAEAPRFARLPPVSQLSRAQQLQSDQRDIVLFAAGAVELRAPFGWWVGEVPKGREVRLVLSPEQPPDSQRMPADSVWISYHAAATGPEENQADLRERLQRRLQLATGDGAAGEQPEFTRVGSWPAAAQQFERTAERENAGRLRGSHMLVRTDWGVVELHFSAPREVYPQRAAQYQQMLAEMVLRAPQQRRMPVRAAQQEAEPILGTWKAYRSRLRLNGEGRIEIELDARQVIPPRNSSQLYDYASKTLVGRFEARGDLLLVEWDDGSKLNLRWKLNEGQLLLTDHEGQISQLRRLYE